MVEIIIITALGFLVLIIWLGTVLFTARGRILDLETSLKYAREDTARVRTYHLELRGSFYRFAKAIGYKEVSYPSETVWEKEPKK